MQITITECDWGEAKRCDIRKLLNDVASHINRELRRPFDGQINVLNLPGLTAPRTFWRRSSREPYEINLTVKGRDWCKFSYQFAHEFCHIISGHDNLRDNPNNWFHETVCELASIFTIRRMAKRWPSHPPYHNWTDYARPLAQYGDDLAAQVAKDMPSEGLFEQWLSSRVDDLSDDPYRRRDNAVVACRLLPVFENDPRGWNAVTQFPTSDLEFPNYLAAWQVGAEPIDRTFVERVTKRLIGNADGE